jgi:hypothetical protein
MRGKPLIKNSARLLEAGNEQCAGLTLNVELELP